MTRLDILCTILSEITNRPAARWDKAVRSALAAAGRDIADTNLLESVPPSEADRLMAELRAEKPAILRWVVGGTQAARRSTPAQRFRLSAYLGNLQN